MILLCFSTILKINCTQYQLIDVINSSKYDIFCQKDKSKWVLSVHEFGW